MLFIFANKTFEIGYEWFLGKYVANLLSGAYWLKKSRFRHDLQVMRNDCDAHIKLFRDIGNAHILFIKDDAKNLESTCVSGRSKNLGYVFHVFFHAIHSNLRLNDTVHRKNVKEPMGCDRYENSPLNTRIF